MVFAGQLRHRLLVESPLHQIVDDVSKLTWSSFANGVPAKVEILPTGEAEQGKVREAETRYKIRVRYRKGYTNKMRITWNGVRMYVERVHDSDNMRRELVIVAKSLDFEQVTFRRSDKSFETLAIRVRGEFLDVDSGGQTSVTARGVDWLFDRADLLLDGKPISPYVGDRIQTEDGLRFYAQPFNGALWRHEDPHRTFVRVHSVEEDA